MAQHQVRGGVFARLRGGFGSARFARAVYHVLQRAPSASSARRPHAECGILQLAAARIGGIINAGIHLTNPGGLSKQPEPPLCKMCMVRLRSRSSAMTISQLIADAR